MTISIQVCFHGLESSAGLTASARQHAEDLARKFPQLAGCRVTIEAPHRHHRKGNPFAVHVDTRLRSSQLGAERLRHQCQVNENAYVALRDAFDVVERRLHEHLRTIREQARLQA